MSKRLTDSFGRVFKTLRLSVTDRCDMRCTYCMPKDGVAWLPKSEILSFEELERLVKVFARLGVTRLRLTGGEPLLRKDLPVLVSRLAAIEGIADLSLTTNGSRLAVQAKALKQAGLQRVTVSLDSLDQGRYKAITRGGNLNSVWQGILRADWEGLAPLKLNCVVMAENEMDLIPLAALTLEQRWEVRFIEVMPISSSLGWGVKPGLNLAQMKERLEAHFGQLEAVPTDAHAPARRYQLPGALGKVGFIASVSEAFCAACDRLRLSATGRLQLCLAHSDGLELKPLLRSSASDAVLERAITEAVYRKPAGHAFYKEAPAAGLAMSQIGG